jgi:glycosyltransferase involved in cell wall biosynthesis
MLRDTIQYIVIDGNSNDGSVEFLQSEKDKFQKCIIEPDNGIYDAINKGLAECVGDYILVLNSGDVLIKDELKEIISNLGQDDIYYCDVDILNKLRRQKHISDHNQLTHRMSISHQGALVARSVYKDNLYDQTYKLSADFAFFNKCLIQGKSFKKLNFTIAEFEVGGRSDTQFITSRLENLRALYRHKQYYYMFSGLIRYVREAIHLGIRALVH